MFGLVLSSRPVLTSPGDSTAISTTQLAFNIPSHPPFSHIALFLLPDASLPQGNSAAVYIQLPGSSEFTLLGALSAEKPSAMFRMRGTVGGAATGVQSGMGEVDMDMDTSAAGSVENVIIGISLEPTEQVQAAIAAQKAASKPTGLELVRVTPTSATVGTPNAVTTKILAQRIISNAFNFLASFGSDNIPLKAFEEWWRKFERKVALDPSFLEREGGQV